MNIEELKELFRRNESENLEFKEAKNSFSILGNDGRQKKSVLGYVVAVGNEGGGKLILGVDDDKNIVGTRAIERIEDAKSQIYNKLNFRIDIEEIFDEANNRIVVIDIPSRQYGKLLKFYGIPLMRVGEELLEMDETTQRNILMELHADFSAQTIPGSSLDELDSDALEQLKFLYAKRNKNGGMDERQLLLDLHLVDDGRLTYAALILLGKESAIRKHLDNAEIIFQYRSHRDNEKYQDRVDYKRAFLLLQNDLWEKINARNQIVQMAEGLLTNEIPAFQEEVIKEIILNAVAHRDYAEPSSIIIKQSPEEFFIQSPGGFLSGVNPKNILRQTKPRNRRIAETLQHLGFVQRAGQGMDIVFKKTLEEGKGLPDFSQSDDFQVSLSISAIVKDENFVLYLEKVSQKKQISFSVDDLMILQNIENHPQKILRNDVQKFIDLGIVEQVGKTRGAKYCLSRNYYAAQGKSGKHTRIMGISRDAKKQLIADHLKRNIGGGRLEDFAEAFPEMKRQDISNLLQELKRQGKIFKMGGTKNGVWKLNNSK
ncbi:MAG: putative DNA binding domain-containing protein [Candidatus Pacebacteria bacterium]|nr:putative DNA binding domain-containing protein [Candidatus Paceibacterota bacterium]